MDFSKLISTRQIMVFVISLLAVFLMVVFQQLGVTTTRLVSPAPTKTVDTFITTIKPKLEAKTNNYHLSIPTQLIPEAHAASDLDLVSAFGVVDFESGEVILEKNLDQKLPIASLTKVMTAVVALDLASLEEEFTVSANAAAQVPTKVMLQEGEKIGLDDLLKALLISSANDSAEVIQEGIDQKYGSPVFIKAMNEKAKFLGLKNSHFTNPQGFDHPQHFSSVEDLAILSQYALKNYPFIAEIVSREFEDLTNIIDERFYLNNWNGLLGVYPGTFGIKTGNTGQAGHTTLVVSEREGKKLLVVILGAVGVTERDLAAAQGLDLGYSKVLGLEPVEVTQDQLALKYGSWKYGD